MSDILSISANEREHRSYEKKGVVTPNGEISYDYISASSYVKPVLDNWFFSRRDLAYGVRGVVDALRMMGLGEPDFEGFEDLLDEAWDSDLMLADLADEHARRVGKYGKADIGTALHDWTEAFDRKQIVLAEVPEVYRADVRAYAAATAGIRWTAIEQTVVNDDLGLIGTADRFGEFVSEASWPTPNWRVYDRAGQITERPNYCFDLKTGHSAMKGFLGMCGQLAGYAHGDFYTEGSSIRKRNPANHTLGFCIWLPAGTAECKIIPLNLRLGLRLIETALEVRTGWKTRKAEAVGRTVTYAMSEQDWRDKIDACETVDQRRDLYLLASDRDELTEDLVSYFKNPGTPGLH